MARWWALLGDLLAILQACIGAAFATAFGWMLPARGPKRDTDDSSRP